MKKIILFFLLLTNISQAKNICSLTFNSSDEKNVLIKKLAQYDYKLIELVPDNKDPNWLAKSCKNLPACDIVIMSGHFGGIFFGEKAVTLSLPEMKTVKENKSCKSLFDSPKSVFLMGCNTLATKTPDHRNVDDYLRVLVGDGFPLNLAEEVAAARYLNFGTSISQSMSTIFNKSQLIIGFDSTSPLGSTNGPLLEEALNNSSKEDKINLGISEKALLKSFRNTNLRVIHPEVQTIDTLKQLAISSNEDISKDAWLKILNENNISKYYDFIIANSKNKNLISILKLDSKTAAALKNQLFNIYTEAQNLSAIKIHILEFLKDTNLIDSIQYKNEVTSVISDLLIGNVDYVASAQLCSVLKSNAEFDLLNNLPSNDLLKIKNSNFNNYIWNCAGKKLSSKNPSKSYQCLVSKKTYDWACLTENPRDLDIEACKLAKSRNPDPENSDDMMWFCYSKMLENRYLNQSTCLELTESFTLLGNQLKMNWNCLNRKEIQD